MVIYCYKCHSLLQHCRKMVTSGNDFTGYKSKEATQKKLVHDVYECPRCKYEIVVWRKEK